MSVAARGILQALDALNSDGSLSTDSSTEKGDNSLLLQRVSDAILRLPFGVRLWNSIQIDPSSITTANSQHFRDQIKREVRRFVRESIQQGTIQIVTPAPAKRPMTQLAEPRRLPRPLGPVHVAATPPAVMTPF